MTRFSWHNHVPQTEAQPATEQPQPAESPLNHHRDSKLGHIMESIRQGLAHEHEKLSTDNGVARQNSQHPGTTTPNNGSTSPALQAVASSKLNENKMGDGSHQNSKTWGWPGLGSFLSHESTTTQQSKSRTMSNGSSEARVEAATFEAIDNAAESEEFGWPGLGSWATSPRK